MRLLVLLPLLLAACSPDAFVTAPHARSLSATHTVDSPGVRFTTQDLGSLGGSETYVDAINNVSQAVGWSSTATGDRRAFIWSATTGMVDLSAHGLKDATGINDAGQVVGPVESVPPLRMGVWTPGAGTTVINLAGLFESFPPIIGAPIPNDINNAGQVVGQYGIRLGFDASRHPFFWSEATGARDLAPFSAPFTNTGLGDRALDINNAGYAVGVAAGFPDLEHVATLWPGPAPSRDQATDLGTLGGPHWAANNVA